MPCFYKKHERLFALLFILIPYLFVFLERPAVYTDTDNYTHALRLTDMLISGKWVETLYMHDNYPFGQVLHFTRIMDVFWLICTLPFLAFMPLKQAVFCGGILYQPVIAALTVLAFLWACRPLFSPGLRFIALVLYFFQPAVLFISNLMAPDHHNLMNLFLLLTTGALIHAFKTGRYSYFRTAGIFAGLAVWTTMEGFLTVYLLLGGLAFAWVLRYQTVRGIAVFCRYFFFSVAVCWLINPPYQGLFFPDNGRLSVLSVTIAGLTALAFYLTGFLEKKNFVFSCTDRIVLLSSLAVLFFGAVILVFGTRTVLAPPISPELFDIWTKHIAELQPSYKNAQVFFFQCLPIFISLFCGLAAFRFSPFQIKKLLLSCLIPLFVLGILTLLCRRFAREAAVFIPFPVLALGAVAAQTKLYGKIPAQIKKAAVIGLFCFCTAALSRYFINIQNNHRYVAEQAEIFIPYLSPLEGAVMTEISRGPETAWGTGRPVIGTPYHSNAEGIIDTHRLLNARSITQAKTLIKKHRITTIIFENPNYHVPDYMKSRLFIDTSSFYGRLAAGRYKPCFIIPVENLPENIGAKFLLFHVDFNQCLPSFR